MNKAVWLQLGVKELIKVSQDFVTSEPNLTADEKSALQGFISSGQNVVTVFTGSATAPSAPKS